MNFKQMRLYCFSPPVMLATFLIEISFALYIVWRYKMTVITRLIVSVLVSLSLFQVSEFAVCGTTTASTSWWTHLGYGAITMLPPLGLHLVHAIAGKPSKWLVPFAYLTAAAFVAYFVIGTNSITGQTCYANYVVFDIHKASAQLYGLYYYGWLLVGTFLAWQWANNRNKHQKAALYALSIGYLSFILPTTTVNIIDPSTISGIPSIMCGFAVILAFILAGKVAPETLKQKAPHRLLRLKLPF